VRKLSAILRVADALDYNREQNVKEVKCALASPETLSIEAIGSSHLKDEIQRAHEKGTLMQEVFNVKLLIRQAKAMPKIANEINNEGRSDAPHPLGKKYSISRRR
jgi:hypothetical protein